MNVLISLYPGYGLGDAVQMSTVLRHVRKYRPDWRIYFQAESGRESVGRGTAHECFTYGRAPDVHYDAEVQIVLYDTFANWHDRPNTRVTSCLHEKFNIPWDRELAQYRIEVPRVLMDRAQTALLFVRRPVAIHYRGDSAAGKKNLSEAQARRVCEHVKKLGCTPLILDWRLDPLSITYGGVTALDLKGGHCAAVNCAVIAECEAFVGIDSGPSKCASATGTPSLVVWTGHHPAQFHDPAPNTTHLVPRGYHGLEPVLNDPGVIKFFEENYSVRVYEDDPVPEICAWLTSSLCW